jgi:hypothetical protein
VAEKFFLLLIFNFSRNLTRRIEIHSWELLHRKVHKNSTWKREDLSLQNILKHAVTGKHTGHMFNNILNKISYTALAILKYDSFLKLIF